MTNTPSKVVKLPRPSDDGGMSLGAALRLRRSVRDFVDTPLSLADVSQLLWAAQGITDTENSRTAPSAGALYPLEVYMAVGCVAELPSGVYKYDPGDHELILIREGDVRGKLFRAAVSQSCVKTSALVVVLAAVYERTTSEYGKWGIRYVDFEVGHVGQNVCLQAVALGLGCVAVGAFDDADVKKVLGLSVKERPVYLLPVGKTA